MTVLPTVSLVIVSRHRPDALARCLAAVARLDHPAFEVIVVADPGSLAQTEGLPIKRVMFDRANISAARNAGIGAAAGEVVAFTDDDATPEPLWLWHLCAPFADPAVSAAGGFVLGWNGFSFEWQGGTVDCRLRTGGLPVPVDRISLHPGRPGLATEIKGVNCAYRRSVLMALGGFDPEIAYYLDETELNLRLAAVGLTTAIVPDARVHHRKAASPRRSADRVPLDLWDVGASAAITLRRHGADEGEIARSLAQIEFWEDRRIARLCRSRRISHEVANGLRASLAAGLADGLRRSLTPMAPLVLTAMPFLPFPSRPPLAEVVLAGRPWQTRRLEAEARRLADEGHSVRLYLFGPSARFQRRYFRDGFWLQSGGLFGRSLRSDPLFRPWRFSRRLARESGLFASGFRKS
jgi:GT2 family glycosyltransferase